MGMMLPSICRGGIASSVGAGHAEGLFQAGFAAACLDLLSEVFS